MKSILMFAYHFYPDNNIGAVRFSELSKRLSNDFKLYIVTKKSDKRTELQNATYIEVGNPPCESSITQKNTNRATGFKYLKFLYNNFIHFKSSLSYYNDFKKLYQKELADIKFDFILATYGPLCNLLCANYVKRKQKSAKFIMDFRDPMDAPVIPFPFRIINKCIQRKICFIADKIVCVSNGYLKKIVKKSEYEKALVLTNGFNKTEQTQKAKDFSFLYVGSTYNGTRDFSPLFASLFRLINGGSINKDDVKIYYAGSDSSYFSLQLEKYNLNSCFSYLGILNRDDCLKKEQECRFLILSTWNKRGYEGVIPGKFFEYLNAQRKIVSITGGNLTGSEVGNLTEELCVGKSIEKNTSEKEIDSFILKEYEDFKNNTLLYNPTDISRFDYDNIALKYKEILNSLGE